MQNNQKLKWLGKSVSVAALMAMMVPSTSYAQLEEIIVTAQKRAESLQEVPVAVTAYTGETLERLAVNDASDLVLITPGLQAAQQGGSNRNFFLRGIGTLDFHLTAAPAVGQYFDDVTLTSGFHARAALFDIERVEVLKGPQNTLFGLNTTGGAINYISRKAEVGAGLNGHAKVTVGTDDLYSFDGAIGFDVGDNAAIRFAINTNNHDGPFESITNGVDFGDENFYGYRAAFTWEPTERTSFTFNVHGSGNENNGAAVGGLGTRDPNSPNPNAPNLVCPEFGNFILDFSRTTNCVSRNGGLNGAPPTNPSTDGFEVVSQNLGLEDIATLGGYAKLEHDFGFASLTLQGSYENLDFEASLDGDGGPTTLLDLNQADDRNTFQYEARLVSDADQRLRWIAGVYYLDEDSDSYTGVISPGIGGGVRIPNVQLFHTKENLGIYGQAEFDLTDTITFTGGLRWSDEDIEGDYLPSSPSAAGLLGTPIFARTVNELVADQFVGVAGRDANGFELNRQVTQQLGNQDLGFTAKVDWKPTDDSLFYASVSRGFKGGALDIRAAFALVPPPNIVASLELNELDPESLLSYEVGYKGSFWDNRIQLDAAAFYYDYSDLQQFVTATGIPQLSNAPGAEVYGFDGNIRYANDSGFYADFGFSVLDSQVTDATDSVFVEGVRLGRTPPFKLSLVAAQDIILGNDNVLTLSGNITHTDSHVQATLPAAAVNADLARSDPSLTFLNANISYAFGNDNQFKLSVFGNNLADENFCGLTQLNNSNAVLGTFAGGLNANATCRTSRQATRTFGASFGVNF